MAMPRLLSLYHALPNAPVRRNLAAFTFVLLLAAMALAPAAFASNDTEPGIITKKIGKVTLLVDPAPKRKGEGPHVKYDGQYYRALRAKKGMEVPLGSVIQTGGFGRARITFPNGDQITVSKSSFFRISYDRKQKKKTSSLSFGSIRGLVRSKGGKEKLQVKTKTMVMGVRGTDFFVSARDASGSSVVNVLRGKVAVAQLPPPAAGKDAEGKKRMPKRLRMVEIPAGFSVNVRPMPKAKSRRSPLKVKPTTKKQLVAVQVETVIKEDPKEQSDIDPEVAAKVAKLEQKAAENCMADIKEYNPTLYSRLKQQGGEAPKSIDAIQTSTVKSMIKQAPVASDVKNKKPTANELKAIDQDIYDRFFDGQ